MYHYKSIGKYVSVIIRKTGVIEQILQDTGAAMAISFLIN